MTTAILPLLGRNLDKCVLAYNSTNALITHFQSNNPKLFTTAHKLRHLSTVLSLSCFVWTAKQVVDIARKNKVIYEVLAIPQVAIGSVVFGAIGWVIFTSWAVDAFNKRMNSSKPMPETWNSPITLDRGSNGDLKLVKIEWTSSSFKRTKKMFDLSQLVVSTALVCLSTNPLFFMINSVALLYSLSKTAQWKAIKFEYQHNNNYNNWYNDGLKYTISYVVSLVEAKKTDNISKSYFCKQHTKTDEEVVNHIIESKASFANEMEMDPWLVTKTTHGIVIDEYLQYKVSIKENSMPTCDCTEPLVNAELSIRTKHKHKFDNNERSAQIYFK